MAQVFVHAENAEKLVVLRAVVAQFLLCVLVATEDAFASLNFYLAEDHVALPFF